MKINKKEYLTATTEFCSVPHQDYNFLDIKPDVGILERHIGLLKDMREDMFAIASLTIIGNTYGNFVASNCYSKFTDIYVHTSTSLEFYPSKFIYIHQCDNIDDDVLSQIRENECIVLAPSSLACFNYYENKYQLTRKMYETVDYTLYVPSYLNEEFLRYFHYYFNDKKEFDYNNLVNLCIMVKNAGEIFEKVLLENLYYVDRWTILDTGSTDGTQDVIRRVMKNKKGRLYEEPFVNFKDSRNACLDFAGKSCKYNVMLDDTYVIQGKFKEFLEEVRGDQFADSYSLIVKSDDTEYYSNRVTKTENNLKYIYKIHEVIQQNDNVNVVIPNTKAWIFDYRNDYMQHRTMDRKQYDLKLLFEDYKENPDDPRSLYYIAQTYNLLGEHEKATEYFLKRAYHHNVGFKQEKVDAIFEAARNYNFKLNKPWEECEKLYLQSYELDPTRPDALYFVGVHYHMKGDMNTSYQYMKKAFEIGYPVHSQFSLKPTLSFYYVPKFLAQLSYMQNDIQTGYACSMLFLEKNKDNKTDPEYETMSSWCSIFEELINYHNAPPLQTTNSNEPVLCFIVDGGYSSWTGRDILSKGVGGSETWAIEMTRYIKKNFNYRVVVFCKCDKKDVFEGVEYFPLPEYYSFIKSTQIHTCVVSRFSKYIPTVIKGNAGNVILALHDISPIGNVIPINEKLKNVVCLSEWHKEKFIKQFPVFKDITTYHSYGIDKNIFDVTEDNKKNRHSFIYSSFPNRGLFVLLKMWDDIKKKFPYAILDIYSDVYGSWTEENFPEEMKEIRKYLWRDDGIYIGYYKNIRYHRWVNKKTLAEAWKKADVWFYPCKFEETFCLTGLEAASTKTLAITNNLAALQTTVGDRGVIIEGDVTTEEWQRRALGEIVEILNDDNKKEELTNKNYEWSKYNTWEKRAVEFVNSYINKDVGKLTNHVFLDNRLDYMDMYNWSNDLPPNSDSRLIFESILKNFEGKRCDILEIGTYTGTSVIEMLKILPLANAVVIDMWENYDEKYDNKSISYLSYMEENNVEKVFYENVKVSGMQNRIQAFKGDSKDVLLYNLNDFRFNFIYVDGSHMCLDTYLDLVLSWRLLRVGGIMGIDGYLYKINDSCKDLERPYEAVEHFMKKYKGNYELINKGYRVFLKKIR
jgi:glycosyltransferase involved in cell wall biosynthesis/predicted O-methyltransferase YrrM